LADPHRLEPAVAAPWLSTPERERQAARERQLWIALLIVSGSAIGFLVVRGLALI
jgi:hypothetical protein